MLTLRVDKVAITESHISGLSTAGQMVVLYFRNKKMVFLC